MSNQGSGAPLPVQIVLGAVLALVGLLLTVSLASDAGAAQKLWYLLPIAVVAGAALAWLNEKVEKGGSPRGLAAPAILLLGCAGALITSSVGEDRQMWIGLASVEAGLAWAVVAVIRIRARGEDARWPTWR